MRTTTRLLALGCLLLSACPDFDALDPDNYCQTYADCPGEKYCSDKHECVERACPDQCSVTILGRKIEACSLPPRCPNECNCTGGSTVCDENLPDWAANSPIAGGICRTGGTGGADAGGGSCIGLLQPCSTGGTCCAGMTCNGVQCCKSNGESCNVAAQCCSTSCSSLTGGVCQ